MWRISFFTSTNPLNSLLYLMKFGSILFTAAAAALCYLQGSTASPVDIQARAVSASTSKVIVGYSILTQLS